MESMLSGKCLKAWLTGLITCLLVIPICFRWLDLPLAQAFQHNLGRMMGRGLPSTIILAGEFAVATTLAVIRMVRGRLPEPGKVLMIAILASIAAFTANNYVLKILFGVPQPLEILFQSAHHGPHLMAGNPASSFPSGHMALAGGFSGVWIRLYPSATPVFAALLAVGMAILVAGDWHFASDVVAGTFIGVTAGLMADALWAAHSASRRD